MTTPSRTTLRDALDKRLSWDDLQNLALDIEAPYDNIGGDTKVGKIRELILYLERRGQTQRLVDWIGANRADIAEELGIPVQPTATRQEPRPATQPPPRPTPGPPPARQWQYEDYEIEMTRVGDDLYAIEVRSDHAARATVSIDLSDPLIAQGLEALRNIPLDSAGLDAVKAMGARLMQTLQEGELAQAYFSMRSKIETNTDQGMRIRLRINAPDLKRLPWEYLYDKQRNTFLALRNKTVISRYLEVPFNLPAVRPPDALRILMILSNPENVTQLDVRAEADGVTSALDPLVREGRVAIDVLTNPVVSDIRRQLATSFYHVIHYSGHAVYTESEHLPRREQTGRGVQFVVEPTRHLKPTGTTAKSTASQAGKGYIVLPDEQGLARLYDEERFAQLFADYNEIRLIVLNACEGAQGSSTERLSGLGERVVQAAGVPAVVAMQYEIADKAAIRFAINFYQMLAHGLPIDAAVAQGRQALSDLAGLDNRAWGTPVLFMRARDGKLFA